MFRFLPQEDDSDKKESDTSSTPSSFVLRKSEEVKPTKLHYDLSTEVPFVEFRVGGKTLKYAKVGELLNSQTVKTDPSAQMILKSTSDLNSGEYEGGFKLWECTFDLLRLLEEETTFKISPETHVLDLGCGHGLLGLYALHKGASVIFSDYNSEVLNYLTIPNVITNFGDEGLSLAKFYSGSWSSILQRIKSQPEGDLAKCFQFDYILSSETIYNLEYLPDFIELVNASLKPGGLLLLGAKTCYFGVGGGTKAFSELVKKTSNLDISTLRTIKEGIHREVLRVEKRK